LPGLNGSIASFMPGLNGSIVSFMPGLSGSMVSFMPDFKKTNSFWYNQAQIQDNNERWIDCHPGSSPGQAHC